MVHGVEQLVDTGAGDRGDKTHRHQVSAAQCPLERAVQLLRIHVLALLEVEFHQVVVEFHHLVHYGGVGVGGGVEVGGQIFGIEVTVGNPRGVLRRQVQGDAFAAESLPDLLHEPGQIGGLAIDLADHDEPGQLHFLGGCHAAPGHQFNAGSRVDHHHGGLHRLQHAHGAPGEVGRTRRVQEIDVSAVVLETALRHVGGILQPFFLRSIVGHRAAALDAAGRLDRAGNRQKFLRQDRLAGAGMPE